MSGVKGGGLLMILGIPFALYVAWQVNGVTRADLLASEPPAEKGATKEQLAAASAKASAWSGESRKAVAVTWQFRAANPEDASADETVSAVVKASAARAADLNDLDRFLSGTDKPVFTGKLKPRYTEWMVEQASLRTDAQVITDWLVRPLEITSASAANDAIEAIIKLTNQYAGRSRFSDKGQAMIWRLRARLKVIDALTVHAEKQYATAIGMKLPLKPDNATDALNSLKGLKAQIASLNADLKQADADKLMVDDAFRVAADAKSMTADEYTAREELLALFAKADLFTNAGGAAPWLKQVAVQYAKTKDEKVRTLIRDKVQEFCDVFIPPVVQLDNDVLVKGKLAPRAAIQILFEPKLGDKVEKKPLSADANDFNEFEVERKPPGFNQRGTNAGTEFDLKDLKPTELSKAAVMYNLERKKVADGTTLPRWTAKSVADLKKKCEAQRELVDQLRKPGGVNAKDELKIATRVIGLAAGMDASKELFEAGP